MSFFSQLVSKPFDASLGHLFGRFCNRRNQVLRLALAGLLLTISPVALQAADEDELFIEQVAPLLERRCVRCHNASKSKGGLDLSTARGLRAGGESGEAVLNGKPDESLLLDMVSGENPSMPEGGPPLSGKEIAVLRRWIQSGAKWPDEKVLTAKAGGTDWWSLKPLNQPDVPDVKSNWVRTEIDAFILQKLKQQGLTPAPEASKRTLIRRLSFDLHGLPPTPEEVDAFLADNDPQSYEKLVDRLLASPRYGERWARHWLDVVHYGDTHGYDKDKRRPHAWPYRD